MPHITFIKCVNDANGNPAGAYMTNKKGSVFDLHFTYHPNGVKPGDTALLFQRINKVPCMMTHIVQFTNGIVNKTSDPKFKYTMEVKVLEWNSGENKNDPKYPNLNTVDFGIQDKMCALDMLVKSPIQPADVEREIWSAF